jgi:tetratricopeptide (TPR) repeat protein
MCAKTALAICFMLLSLTAPELAKQHFDAASGFYKQNDVLKAKAEWKKSLEYEPGFEPSLLGLQALEKEEFKEDSNNSYNGAVKEFYEKGLVFYRKGEYCKAGDEWEKALGLCPENKQIKAFLKSIKPDVKEEKKASEKAASKKQATAKESVKNKDEVQAAVVKTGINEKIIDELYYKGLKFYKQGKIKEAKNEWEQVLRLDPSNKKTLNNLKKLDE